MTHLIQFLFSLIASSARTRLSLQLEVAALRHQLSVYRVERRKPRISSSDRLLSAYPDYYHPFTQGSVNFRDPQGVLRI